MDSGGFIKWFFLLSFALFLLFGWFVYFIDPYWSFSHSSKFNNLQFASNERVQKSNMIFFKKFDYDTLILGSSRVTFINQNDFIGMKAFNYSFSLALPSEYEAYIDFAKDRRGGEFKNIIIGMDFFGSNKNVKKKFNSKDIFKDIRSVGYRYKMLFSIDAIKNSLENLKRSLLHRAGGRSYDRENIAYTTKMDKTLVQDRVENMKMEDYIGNMDEYLYDENFKNILLNLKINNPNTKFMVFTTPVSSNYLKKLFNYGLYDDYIRWIKSIVEVFGEVVHFMNFNTITNAYPDFFMDYHHLYPEFTHMIVNRILKRDDKNIARDFGVVLKKEY